MTMLTIIKNHCSTTERERANNKWDNAWHVFESNRTQNCIAKHHDCATPVGCGSVGNSNAILPHCYGIPKSAIQSKVIFTLHQFQEWISLSLFSYSFGDLFFQCSPPFLLPFSQFFCAAILWLCPFYRPGCWFLFVCCLGWGCGHNNRYALAPTTMYCVRRGGGVEEMQWPSSSNYRPTNDWTSLVDRTIDDWE